MLSRYVEVSAQPYVLERRGLSPVRTRRAMVIGWLVLLAGSLGAHPYLAAGGSDLGAISFIGMIFSGTFGVIVAYLSAYARATRGIIVGQPARVEAGPTELRVDRHRWPAQHVQRIEVHQVPMGEAPDQWFVALVLRTVLVELVFEDDVVARRTAELLRRWLGVAPPVTLRKRPQMRGYAVPTVLVFLVAIGAQIGAAIWLLAAAPPTPLHTLPIAAVALASLGLLFLVARAISGALVRGYLHTEYGIDVTA